MELMDAFFLPLLFSIIGGVFTYFGIKVKRKNHKIELKGFRTKAEVIGFKEEVDDGTRYYYPILKFTMTSGEIKTITSSTGTTWKTKNKHLNITYASIDGELEVLVDSSVQRFIPSLFIFLGVIAILFAALLFAKHLHFIK